MNETFTIQKSIDERIDALEAELLKDEADYETHHVFTNGLYTREIFMPAGHIVVSKIHRTEHQYFILKGAVAVKINDGEWEYLMAPAKGITKPGTRRVLYILSDCVWITSHPTNKTTVQEVEDDIIEPHINSVLGMKTKDFKTLKTNQL